MKEDKKLIEQAKEIFIQNNKASVPLLQRRLQIGYARAALIIDILEEQGFVGKANGSKPREILMPQPTTNNLEIEGDLETDITKTAGYKYNNLEGLERLEKILLNYTEKSEGVPAIKGIPIFENTIKELKQFISDLRKHDMEELIKMLPEEFILIDNKEFPILNEGSKIRKLIKDYYNN